MDIFLLSLLRQLWAFSFKWWFKKMNSYLDQHSMFPWLLCFPHFKLYRFFLHPQNCKGFFSKDRQHTKGRFSLFNLFIDMRTTVSLSISCGKNVFLLENFNKNTFFLHEMDKLTVVLMSIKWLNKKRWPLTHNMTKYYMSSTRKLVEER